MIRALVLAAFLSLCAAAPQFLISSSVPEPHPAVIENEVMEAALPDELKNNFYKNPFIAAALAGPSWFGPKEGQVTHRETDMITRDKIYSILHHAGFARR